MVLPPSDALSRCVIMSERSVSMLRANHNHLAVQSLFSLAMSQHISEECLHYEWFRLLFRVVVCLNCS